MQTYRGDLATLRRSLPPGPYAMTIGNFDGVHAGHQYLLSQLFERARALSCPSLLLTFDPHPLFVLSPDSSFRMIMSRERQEEVLGELGLEILVSLAFDKTLAAMAAKDFVSDVLRPLFHPALILVGEEFRFGAGRQGTLETLSHELSSEGTRVIPLSPFMEEGHRISSSRIRKAVDQGEIEQANRLLTRPLEISGPVVQGEQRGRLLGFPTLNLIPPEHRLVPPPGVYATRTRVEGVMHDSATYIGTKPTFGTHRPVIETHLPGFSGDLYGVDHEVFFYHRVRGERSFPNVDALKSQIASDIDSSLRYLHDIVFEGSVRPL